MKIGKPCWRRFDAGTGNYGYALAVKLGDQEFDLIDVIKPSELWTIDSLANTCVPFGDNIDGKGYTTAREAKEAAVKLLKQILKQL